MKRFKATHLYNHTDGEVDKFEPAIRRGWWCPVCGHFAEKSGDNLICDCTDPTKYLNNFKQWLRSYTKSVRRGR